MFDFAERNRCAELIIMTLAKFCVLVELSKEPCPLCHKAPAHDAECPMALAWSLLDTGQQEKLRRDMRALALSMGSVGACADTLIH